MNTTATVTIDLNDAEFLSHLLKKYIADNNIQTEYLQNLAAHLAPKAGC